MTHNTNIDVAALTASVMEAMAPAIAQAVTAAVQAQFSAPIDLTEKAAPAKPRARKAPAKKAPAKKAPAKSVQTRETLSRKDWNNTFSALVRTSGLRDARGVSLYRVSMNRWTEVQALRDAGVTPAEAVKAMQAGKNWA